MSIHLITYKSLIRCVIIPSRVKLLSLYVFFRHCVTTFKNDTGNKKLHAYKIHCFQLGFILLGFLALPAAAVL